MASYSDMTVLQLVVEMLDRGDRPTSDVLAKALDLTRADVSMALSRLESRGYLTTDKRLSGIAGVRTASPEAYRAVEAVFHPTTKAAGDVYVFGDNANFVAGNNFGELRQGRDR